MRVGSILKWMLWLQESGAATSYPHETDPLETDKVQRRKNRLLQDEFEPGC